MARRKRPTPEQIISKLREAEVLLSQGKTIGEAARQLGVSEQTYYRWRNQYGGMKAEEAKLDFETQLDRLTLVELDDQFTTTTFVREFRL